MKRNGNANVRVRNCNIGSLIKEYMYANVNGIKNHDNPMIRNFILLSLFSLLTKKGYIIKTIITNINSCE